MMLHVSLVSEAAQDVLVGICVVRSRALNI
jgi:hypothetical protein